MSIERRILVVDDEMDIREVLTDLISDSPLKATVDCAENGQVAIDLLKQNSYDVVITDLNMPQKTGLELIEELKSIASTVPVIVVSAYLDDDHIRKAWQMGAFDYLKKVEVFEKLEETLRIALNIGRDFVTERNQLANKEVIPVRLHLKRRLWEKVRQVASENGTTVEETISEIIDKKVVGDVG